MAMSARWISASLPRPASSSLVPAIPIESVASTLTSPLRSDATCSDEPLGQLVDAVAAARFVRQRADELIASDARHDAIAGKLGMQAAGDFDQHLVAHLVAVEVVDLLEIVEVDHQHGEVEATKLGTGDQGVDGGAAAAPIEAAGQRIEFGQFARALLGPAALGHFVMQLVVAAPAEHEQGDVEQHCVGEQHVGCAARCRATPARSWASARRLSRRNRMIAATARRGRNVAIGAVERARLAFALTAAGLPSLGPQFRLLLCVARSKFD
jgi:hypothetical protein